MVVASCLRDLLLVLPFATPQIARGQILSALIQPAPRLHPPLRLRRLLFDYSPQPHPKAHLRLGFDLPQRHPASHSQP